MEPAIPLPAQRSQRLALWLLVTAAGVGAFVALGYFSLPGGRDASICISRRFLNLPCPGCGLTRATAALARGDWLAVWNFHPLAPLLLAQGAFFWGLVLVRIGKGTASIWPEIKPPWLLANVGALLAIWLVRLVAGTLPY